MVKFYLKVELRRVEGIFLRESLLGHLDRETLQKARELSLKLTTRIPDVIKSMLLNQRIKARVIRVGGDYVLLRLDSEEEVLVKNGVANLTEGEEVILQLVSRNPYILKVISSRKLLKATAGILRNIKNLKGFSLHQIKSFEGFKNSGLFYERKLFKAILEGSLEELSRDLKYQALVRKDTEFVEFITLLQTFSLEQGGGKILLPIGEEGKTKLLLKKTREGFRFLVEISSGEDVLLLEIQASKGGSFISLRILSSSQKLLEKLEGLERLKTKVPIIKFEKEVAEPDEIRRIFLSSLTESTVLNLRV